MSGGGVCSQGEGVAGGEDAAGTTILSPDFSRTCNGCRRPAHAGGTYDMAGMFGCQGEGDRVEM